MITDGLEETALLRLSRNEGGTGLATLFPAALVIQAQSGLELLGTRGVALIALFHQNRADVLLEKGDVGRAGGGQWVAEREKAANYRPASQGISVSSDAPKTDGERQEFQ